jgi:HEAT repeat protein
MQKLTVEALGQSGDPRAAEPLFRALKDRRLRGIAAQALLRLGYRAVDALCEALNDPVPAVRSEAARILGHIPERRTMLPLCAALKDSDRKVREEVVEALGRVGDARVVPDLIELLTHTDPAFGRAAARVLGEIAGRRAIPPLCEAVRGGSVEAAVALGQIARRDPGPELADALPMLRGRIRTAFWDADRLKFRTALRRVVEALGPVGDARAVWPLIDVLRDRFIDIDLVKGGDDETFWLAAVALTQIASRHPVPELSAALPALRGWKRWLVLLENPERERLHREVLQTFESVSAGVKDLPIPATALPPPGESLPVPAEPPMASRKSLPIASDTSLPGSGSLPVPAAADARLVDEDRASHVPPPPPRTRQRWWRRPGWLPHRR